MKRTIFLVSALLIGACATNPPRDAQNLGTGNAAAFTGVATGATATAVRATAAQAAAPKATNEAFTAVKTVTSQEADNGRVCEHRTRPGSHMAQKYCYTREQHAANQELRDDIVRQQVAELEREQRLQSEMHRQMEMERQRRQGAFGRN